MPQVLVKKIRYLDGRRLRRGLIAGANRVIERHEHLNDINVFPVPDGDTGSNMAGTMRSIASASKESTDDSISQVSNAVAKSALLGARGNSGAILAQFMCGFSEGVKGLSRIHPEDFARAAVHAAQKAREAISSPKDGTILSVIQDWAEHLKKNSHSYDDFHLMLKDSIVQARSSLAETKEKLAALKVANVVDAGAQGFVYLLEGIQDFIERGSLNQKENTCLPSESKERRNVKLLESLTFLYCTECLLEIKGISSKEIHEQLLLLGGSIVVAGTDLVRIHVHTNDPAAVLNKALQWGTVHNAKVENMLIQHQEQYQGDALESEGDIEEIPAIAVMTEDVQDAADTGTALQCVGIVVDSVCDMPEALKEELDILTVPLHLVLDDAEFLDKVEISADEFNRRLPNSKCARTSQPAPAEFVDTFTRQLARYPEVLSIHMAAKHSGTFQSATVISKTFEGHVHVVDGYAVSAGLGLLTLAAARRAREGMDIAGLLENLEADKKNLRFFVSMDTLDFAVRGGRMSKGTGLIGKYLHIKPVLEFATRHQGQVEVIAKPLGIKSSENKLLQFVDAEMQKMRDVCFAIVHVNALETANRYAHELRTRYAVEPQYIMAASPAVGIHSGPGACAITMLGTL